MINQNVLISHSNPKSPISEAFRVLRTNIQFLSFDKKLKTILITSSGMGEGKTTVISNLAITMAQTGSKVLLIDGDLRKPKIHQLFSFSNSKGLTNLLISRHGYDKDFIQNSGIDNLDILVSGPIPPNPSELLGSSVMKDFLLGLKDYYDIILIDTPPVGTVTDAAVLSTITDGVILLISSGNIQIKAAQRAKELLLKVNANIIGVALNNINTHDEDGYYYSYYYSDENSKNKKKKSKKTQKQEK